jgi:fumarylpyruvate hydrolase
MTSIRYVWAPPEPASVAVQGSDERLPVQRLFFVGRNYHAHAKEMGRPVDEKRDRPFYFTKSHSALLASGSSVPYPQATSNYHYELELVVALRSGGADIAPESAHEHIYGYGCGLDMTRRDLQFAARDQGKPWDTAKDCENSAVISPIVPMPGQVIERGRIELRVDGEQRQDSDMSNMIWGVRELIADLSRMYHLRAGDLIYTGTPEGVGPVLAGQRLDGSIEGVGTISLQLLAADA